MSGGGTRRTGKRVSHIVNALSATKPAITRIAQTQTGTADSTGTAIASIGRVHYPPAQSERLGYNRTMKRDPRLVRLSREHTQALLLAQRIEREFPAAKDDQVDVLYSSVIAYWSAGLLPHFSAESECLLARLIRHVPIDDERVAHLQRDHLAIEGLIVTMRDARDRTERKTVLRGLAERLRAHVRWEEDTLFPATEALLRQDELDALGRDLAARLPEQPRPFWEALEQ